MKWHVLDSIGGTGNDGMGQWDSYLQEGKYRREGVTHINHILYAADITQLTGCSYLVVNS